MFDDVLLGRATSAASGSAGMTYQRWVFALFACLHHRIEDCLYVHASPSYALLLFIIIIIIHTIHTCIISSSTSYSICNRIAPRTRH